ncbi:glycosyltransferase family protein [Ornithinibacillus xuwenensis]|uniref:Glycosyltransferase n=1 Tax=Ornithinibacillus xuwenensis TaxID=3144668 RepID=A0ABU9XIM0_9BACI
MNKKLTILILIKPFDQTFPKHKPKMEMIREIENFAEVYYWYQDGDIRDILSKLNITPDFIFHYDIAWDRYALAPKITGLDQVNIPKGCFVIDLHWNNPKREAYIYKNKIDLIFSVSKHPFLTVFPKFENKLCWLPWSINPKLFKDWNQEKTIDFLLMGLVYSDDPNLNLKVQAPKGRYAFRDQVLERMKDEPGFVFHPHPGHFAKGSALFMNEKYAKELNRSKIFFTCGSTNKTGSFAVLKYFEALGCKTLLLAEPNKDVKDLGFIDGVNYVACNTENFYEKAHYYLKNEGEREKIVAAGYQFIHQNHTNQVRAKQFVNYVQEFISRTDTKHI